MGALRAGQGCAVPEADQRRTEAVSVCGGGVVMGDLFVNSSASISDCGSYRYRLDRRWSNGPTMGFIMLNPSTADADKDDPTIRRCIGFAKREGCGALVVVNLFAFRATDPKNLPAKSDEAEGPENAAHIMRAATVADRLVAAWGSNKPEARFIRFIFDHYGDRVLCLGKTKDGSPRHPLYVRGDAPLIPLWT